MQSWKTWGEEMRNSLLSSVAIAILAGAAHAQAVEPATPHRAVQKAKVQREARQERHEVRKADRIERREDRKDDRIERREVRKDDRIERRETRQDDRAERREDRQQATEAERRESEARRTAFRTFLRKHPALAKELFQRADKDGNGELDKTERAAARIWMKKHQLSLRKQYGEQIARFEEHLDANDDGKISGKDHRRGRVIHKRLDRNDDGKVGRREWESAKKIKKTMDLDKDGKLDRHEVRVTRRVVRHADKNGDGKLGIGERHQVKKTLDRKSKRTVRRQARK